MAAAELILASQSRARADLLRACGLAFRQVPSGAAEPPADPGEAFEAHLLRLARLKACAVAERHPGAFVLAADTALRLDGHTLGKADDEDHAVAMLAALAGRTHQIATAVCVLPPAAAPAGPRHEAVDSAWVTLHAWPPERIRAYVRAIQPFHCAGAYAVQEGGMALLERLEGDPSTVVGLPVRLTLRLLAEAGAAGPFTLAG
jgi:septum formation protein